MGLRSARYGAVAATWAFVVWMGSHVSTDPSVFGRWSSSYVMCVFGLAAVAGLVSWALLPHTKPWVGRNKFKIAAVCASSVIALGLVELMIRVLDVAGVSYYEESRRYHLDKVADPVLRYRHAPNTTGTYFGVNVRFNQHGFRGPYIGERKPGERCILFVGDSVTAGIAVPYEKTFCTLVARQFERELGHPVLPFNSGCGSYDTTQELAVIKKYVPELAPDLVIVIVVDNDASPRTTGPFDPWSSVEFADNSPPQTLNLIAYHSWTYRLAKHLVRRVSAQRTQAKAVGPDWDASFDALKEAAAFCERAKVPLGVLLWRRTRGSLTDSIWTRLDELLRDGTAPYVDLVNAYEKAGQLNTRISPVDIHNNELGHEVIAGYISEFIEKHKLLQR